jgi:GNAT superfamily N-acetyltransferase
MSTFRPTHTLLDAYPKDLVLDDGTRVTVRPLRAGDQAALLAFFRSIPEADRWWLREDVSDPAVIRRWITDLDYDRVLPLVALVDERIVADATLHRRGFGARNQVGELRVVVAPPYRGRGLAYALLADLTEIAAAAGLRRLEAEIVGRAQTGALEAIEQLGFERAAVIPDHLLGPDGSTHDLLILVYPLSEERE